MTTWMDLEIIILSEVSHTNTNDITYMWNLKYDTNKHPRNRNRLTNIENRLVVAKVWVGEEWIGRLRLADSNYYI